MVLIQLLDVIVLYLVLMHSYKEVLTYGIVLTYHQLRNNIGDSYGGGIVFYLYGSGNTSGGLIASYGSIYWCLNGVVKDLDKWRRRIWNWYRKPKYN